MRTPRDPAAYMGQLARAWNRTGFTPAGKARRLELTRRTLRQQWHDHGRRGRGSKAWRRLEAIRAAEAAHTYDPFALAASVLREDRR